MLRSIPALFTATFLLVSCGSMQQATLVRDDVYFMPSDAPPPSAVVETPAEAPAQPTDDYYDANAGQAAGSGDFYDMTYNDPYYYNYGRFGFNASMGWQNGWSGPGWGMGMGWNSGMGWGNPWYSMGIGWGNPYYGGYGGWGYPYYGWNDPWYGGYGYGYGGYYSPYGNCYCCYTPVIIGGSSGVVVGHRPSMNSGGSGMATTGGTHQARGAFRDPVRLAPTLSDRGDLTRSSGRGVVQEPAQQSNRLNYNLGRPAGRPAGTRLGVGSDRPAKQRGATIERSRDNVGGGSERSIGSSPSRGGSGGNNGGGNSGGGSRSGGGGRPR